MRYQSNQEERDNVGKEIDPNLKKKLNELTMKINEYTVVIQPN